MINEKLFLFIILLFCEIFDLGIILLCDFWSTEHFIDVSDKRALLIQFYQIIFYWMRVKNRISYKNLSENIFQVTHSH